MQKILNSQQIAAFYHDAFVQRQVEHFKILALTYCHSDRAIVDIGGGCGYFAHAIKRDFNLITRVVDMDPVSVKAAQELGIEAQVGDAINPIKRADEGVICFNLILHHLVSDSESKTRNLQITALSCWRETGAKIFVNEYIYESWIRSLSGWLIYQITKNKFLSATGRIIAKFLPSLNANTFGTGVRFRSNSEWKSLFDEAGFWVKKEAIGKKEYISIPRRILFIKQIRRDSFLLYPK